MRFGSGGGDLSLVGCGSRAGSRCRICCFSSSPPTTLVASASFPATPSPLPRLTISPFPPGALRNPNGIILLPLPETSSRLRFPLLLLLGRGWEPKDAKPICWDMVEGEEGGDAEADGERDILNEGSGGVNGLLW